MRVVGFLKVRTGSRPARARIIDAGDLGGRTVLPTIVALRRTAFALRCGLAVGTRCAFATL